MKNRNALRQFVPLILAGVSAQPAAAQFNSNSVQVGARIASFQIPALRGSVTTAIIYEPGNSASEAEARLVERSLGNGLPVGAIVLRPRRVSIKDLGSLGDARVAFVTKGIDYRNVAEAVAKRRILTISADRACASSGNCAVAVTSAPKVQIFVSRAGCNEAGIRFSAAFLMLVREL